MQSPAHTPVTVALRTPARADLPQGNDRGDDAPRSAYRSGFGEELPAAVYGAILAGFALMLAVAWLAFGGALETGLDLVVVTVLCIVFLALPIILHSAARAQMEHTGLRQFLSARIDTATGPVSGREASIEILLIPAALALAAIAIGIVYALFG